MADVTAYLFAGFILLVVFLYLALWALTKLRIPTSARKEYGIKSITEQGILVRSISEKRIADYFDRINIKYQYERGAGYGLGHPDFYLPDYDVYVEYWGLVNADDLLTRERYVRHMKRKMAIYHKHNLRLVSIYPQNMENLNWIFRQKFRQATGYELDN
ncbi:MAG: hypothetical protein ABSG33_10260 [Candidatus Bathyarchaeia archaeon]|jgi:hypothetical protein